MSCQILRLNAQNSIFAGAPPQTPLGELTDPVAVFKGPTSKRRDEEVEGGLGEGMGREEEGKSRG